MKSFTRSGILVAAAVLCSGCSVLGIDNGAEEDLKDQRRAWLQQNFRDYTYEFQRSCFCVDIRPVIITVQDDVVTSIVTKETGAPVTEYLEQYKTITDLYDYLIDVAEEADEMKVTFDNSRHIPKSVAVDYIENAADDEFTISISNFNLTGS